MTLTMQKTSSEKIYKITISYDGTDYFGWQIQPKKISIQSLIEKAIQTCLREKINIIGAGRTDAKVHAKAQIAHFSTDKKINLKKFKYSLNSLLPEDIRITKIEPAKNNFHARYSAKGKIYQYKLCLNDTQNPFTRKYTYKPKQKIDTDLLIKATEKFIGTHDFTSFANKTDQGCAKNKPIKTLKKLNVIKTSEGVILEFEADGFLYKMIRNITGTLLEAASGKISIDEIPKILKAKDRTKAKYAVPAHGLTLIKVIY